VSAPPTFSPATVEMLVEADARRALAQAQADPTGVLSGFAAPAAPARTGSRTSQAQVGQDVRAKRRAKGKAQRQARKAGRR
jgi:hypothetical protein